MKKQHILILPLNAISGNTEENPFILANFVDHSQKVGEMSEKVLVWVHTVFTSKGPKTWLKHDLTRLKTWAN